mgnify:CR=1 FL=1
MTPATEFIPFARPSLGREEEEAVLEVLRSGWLTTGRVTHEFETAFARTVKCDTALAVNSGTAGLHLALEAFGIGDNDKVVTTPYTFAATAEVIRYVGAHPVFVDVDPATLNIDPDGVARAVKTHAGKVRALLPVHIGGLPCAIRELTDIARHAGISLIEDCAHAFPVSVEDRTLGLWGQAGVYSFYANKTITTGEGGMIVTHSPEAAARMRLMRTHGIDREAWDRYTSPRNSWYYEIVEAGYKYNLTDIAAAIGLVQLKKAEVFKRARAAVAHHYLNAFATGSPACTRCIHTANRIVWTMKLESAATISGMICEVRWQYEIRNQ